MNEYGATIIEDADKQGYTVYTKDSTAPQFSVSKSEVNGYSMIQLTNYIVNTLKEVRRKRDAELATAIANEIMVSDLENKITG